MGASTADRVQNPRGTYRAEIGAVPTIIGINLPIRTPKQAQERESGQDRRCADDNRHQSADPGPKRAREARIGRIKSASERRNFPQPESLAKAASA